MKCFIFLYLTQYLIQKDKYILLALLARGKKEPDTYILLFYLIDQVFYMCIHSNVKCSCNVSTVYVIKISN